MARKLAVPPPPSEQEADAARRVYRWRGVGKSGATASGVTELTPAEMSAMVEQRYGAGWRELWIVTGNGLIPPAWGEVMSDACVAGIDRVDGKRTWWAERP
jgi:hypothetical protein